MVEMSTKVQIPASPSRVWAILTDFPGYSTWIAFLRIEGQAALDERLTYVFASDQAGVRWRSFPALVVTCDPAREIGWTAGVPYLLKIEERFQILPTATGSLISHTARVSGFAAVVIGRQRIRRRFLPFLESINRALASKAARP